MTQIVIPKVTYPSHLDQQNIFQPSITLEDFPPNPIYSQKTLSKKPAGAFKFYKLKKLRKAQADSTNSQPPAPTQQPQLHITYRIKLKPIPNPTEESISKLSPNSDPPFAYFDPSIAPLYTTNSNISLQSAPCSERILEKNGIFALEIQQKIIVQKKSPKNIQIIDSQVENLPQFQYQEEQPQVDDAFIIVKKVQVKRTKLKRSIDSTLGMSKLGKKSKENELFEAKISKITQLHQLKIKELDTPSVKSKEECLLPDTEKSEHSKMQEMMQEARQIKIEDNHGKKRFKSQITDCPDFSQYSFYSEHQMEVAKNLFGSCRKSTKSEFHQ